MEFETNCMRPVGPRRYAVAPMPRNGILFSWHPPAAKRCGVDV